MTRPVRVSFVAPHAVLGGAEAVLVTLVRGLGPEWVAGVVVLQDGPLVEQLRSEGIEVAVVPAGRRLGMLPAGLRLRRALAAQGADVVHANGLKAALVCLLGGPRRAPLLWMKHDATGDPWLTRAVAAGCQDVVGVSATALEALRRRRRPKAVVYNGLPERAVDRVAGRAAALRALGDAAARAGASSAAPAGAASPGGAASPSGAPDVAILGLAGRLAFGKGHHELIAALPRILARRPEARVLLIGPEDPAFPAYRGELLSQVAALGLADRVVLAGHRDDVPLLLSGCDVVVAPSVRDPGGWREGFGLVVAEAMQAAVPVVAYASGSLPEVLGPAGRLVPEGDRAGLADAVVTLLEDPAQRAAHGAAGAARVTEFFRADRSLEAIRTRYVALAGPPAAADLPTPGHA